ncbi:MAG TPA: adenylate/guanylate cyclase domain-containing protein [Flavobacteriales bacterium]|nr:adenylate/guanylate cyclase domain-containing protein [Flavobacteriales bacterium]
MSKTGTSSGSGHGDGMRHRCQEHRRYISAVCIARWSSLGLALVLSCNVLFGQLISFKPNGKKHPMDQRDLHEEMIAVPGHGLEVPGLDFSRSRNARHIVADDSSFAARVLEDSTWMTLRGSRDTVVSGGLVHWVRFHVDPGPDTKRTLLVLNIAARAKIDVFLNGRPLLSSGGTPSVISGTSVPAQDSLLLVNAPFSFVNDGLPEVITVRISTERPMSLNDAGFIMVLQAADANYAVQRRMLHFGVFTGINAILLILALVIWSFDRSDRSWLLLALLSLVSALDTICEVGYTAGALGVAGAPYLVLGMLRTVLMPWPMYLLIMVLGVMRGDLSRRRMKWYTIAVIIVTLICAASGVGELLGWLDGTDGLTVLNDSIALVVVVIVLAALFAVIIIWFAIDVVRLAIRLLRSKGYARWIGGGALASSLLTIALRMTSGIFGGALSSTLDVIADYCSYVAVPISIAIYLAVRSAHHNRLVARQRDELDEEVKERTAELSAERDRSDELLLNILPADVAEELKRTGEAAAKHYETVTILFTDFKGFTQASEQLAPQELVEELNTCFKAFDAIITERGIEKIKTIGDAYMCAGGLPDPGSSSPVDVVHAALEMQAFMIARKKERDAQGKPAFEMRVGIHTGPVVAGIVGVKKFQYDIWGDTVNTASRMESSGEVGQVNVSEATYALVKEEAGLAFTSRGKVQAKGKGEMEMYFVS